MWVQVRKLEVLDPEEPAINLASQLWTEWSFIRQQVVCIASDGAAASDSGVAWLKYFQNSTKGSIETVAVRS